ncbi:hypothetical protein ACMYSQ_008622 [Aspergillus niger]
MMLIADWVIWGEDSLLFPFPPTRNRVYHAVQPDRKWLRSPSICSRCHAKGQPVSHTHTREREGETRYAPDADWVPRDDGTGATGIWTADCIVGAWTNDAHPRPLDKTPTDEVRGWAVRSTLKTGVCLLSTESTE